MIIRPAIFFLTQAGVCLYAAQRGGQPERWTAATMAIAAVATFLLPNNPRTSFRYFEPAMFGVDAAFLLVLVVLFCRANRFWPIWVAALQLISIGVHAIKAYDVSIIPGVYSALAGWIAYPMMALLVIGTYRHERRSNGTESLDWTPIVW